MQFKPLIFKGQLYMNMLICIERNIGRTELITMQLAIYRSCVGMGWRGWGKGNKVEKKGQGSTTLSIPFCRVLILEP